MQEIVQKAIEARKDAYVPYSGFKVGAAVVTDTGKIYTGCNIENASYGLTNCAERTAIFKAVSEGEKKLRLMVVAADASMPVTPCGACRQVMQEFGIQEVVLANSNGKYTVLPMAELFPHPFTCDTLD